MVLLLFDIDGTLLRGAAQAHAEALRAAMHAVYGIGSSDGAARALPVVQAAGRTDMEIARELATKSGCSEELFQERMGDLQARTVVEYQRRVPADLSAFAVPGIGPLLAELDRDAEARLSLLTGNLEGIARLKLERAGLGSHFPAGQGGFGSDSEDRNDLPGIARARAGAPGDPHPRELTLVIGDTPRDIACARADGVRCIAVTSGPYDAEELLEADDVARSAGELRALILAQLRASRL